MSKRKALGRGLNALLSDSESSEDRLDVDINSPKREPAIPARGIAEIPITEIEVNPYQPRTHFDQDALQELADSIKVHGR
jgi:ParB family chromosome partitioning protein